MKRDIFIVVDKTAVPKETDSYRLRKNFEDIIRAIPHGFSFLNTEVDYSVSLLSFSDKFSPDVNIHDRFLSVSNEPDIAAVANAEKADMLVPWGPIRACIDMGLSEYRRCLLKKISIKPPVIILISGGDFCKSSRTEYFSERWGSLTDELRFYEKTGMLEIKAVAISSKDGFFNDKYISALSLKAENVISVNLDSDRKVIIETMKRIYRQEI